MKLEKIGRTTSASVEKHTGRTWDQWVALLTKAGALGWPRREIVLFVRKKYRLSEWWEQIVTSGYELAVDRRIEGQNEKGLYSVAGSKTLPLTSARAWKLLLARPDVWLRSLAPVEVKVGAQFESEGGAFGEFRTIKAGSSVRFRWQEDDWEKPTTVVLSIVARPGSKCIVTFSQTEIPSTRAKEERRKYWKSVLDELTALTIKK